MNIKKQKGQKSVIKVDLKFSDYKKIFKSISNWKLNKLFRKKRKMMVLVSKKSQNIKKVILRTQQRFKSERHNVFTEEFKNINLSSHDDKRMQSIGSLET